MKVYLYLEKEEWAEVWVNGGEIPINLASAYRSDERTGTMTPDENLIHESNVDLMSLSPMIHFGKNANIKNLSILNSSINGKLIPDISNAHYYREDGLILSFCNHLSPETAHKFGKAICVEILDIRKTKREIDEQLGVTGNMKKCSYTDDHQRNHFLKHKDDSWQDEFRIFWKSQRGRTWVNIPSGTAKIVWTLNS